MDIEVLARAIGNQMVGYKAIKPLSLMGFTSLWMFLVGGVCGVIIGCLNDRPPSILVYFKNLITLK